MRVKIIQKPSEPCIDGIQLDQFHVGRQYVVGTSVGALLLCQGWAEPIDDDSPALLIPLSESTPERPVDDSRPPNLLRDESQPHYEGRATAMDHGRRRRRGR